MMRLLRFGFVLLFALPFGLDVVAQQVPVHNQYMLNNYLNNPAIAGYEGVTEICAMGREQWVGYSERPRTYSLSFQTRIFQSSGFGGKRRAVRRGRSGRRFLSALLDASMGVGAIIYNDINGRMRRTGIQGSYSYMLYVNSVMFSLGLNLSFQQYKANVLPEDLYAENDELVALGKPNVGYAPDAGVGFLVSSMEFYLGVSASNLTQNMLAFGKGNPSTKYRQLRQYHLMGGYRFLPGSDLFALEPAVALVVNERPGWMLDVSFRAYYDDNYWGGVAFRTRSNLVLMAGLRYQHLLVGYAFEYAFGSSQTVNKAGSHEFMVGWRMGDLDRRGRVVRKF